MTTTSGRDLYFDHESLREFCKTIFMSYDLPEDEARTVADNLVMADLRGVYSHGVSRMPIYTKRLELKLFNARAGVRVKRTAASTAVIDGDNGMGAVIGLKAMDLACEMAAETGIGAVSVHNSNHYGTAAYFLNRPISRGYIGGTCTNAGPAVTPYGGCEPLLGTNPFGIGIPGGKNPPVIADLATSVTAKVKIVLADQRGEDIPLGFAVDSEGRPTTSPKAALLGALLPFGGHKGSAIAILVEVFASVLSGAKMLKQIPDFYRELNAPSGYGHFFAAIDISRFMDFDQFQSRIELMIGMLKACRRAQGGSDILMPGELEANLEAERLKAGIPLPPDTVEGLRTLGQTWGVALPGAGNKPLA